MFMILAVVDDPGKLDAVLEGWKKAGTGGVTVFESVGMHRLLSIPPVPMRFNFGSAGSERGNYTIFSVVDTEKMVARCLEAFEQVVGDLGEPNTGIFIAWPLTTAKGVSGKNLPQGGTG